MYQVTAKVAAVEEDFPGSRVEWKVGQTREVHDSLIERFRNNPAAWTLSGGATSSPLMTTTNLTGGIELSAGGSSFSIPQTVSATLDRFYSSRPARLKPINTLIRISYSQDGTYVYGIATLQHQLVRQHIASGFAETNGYAWPAGYSINGVFCGLGVVFAIVRIQATDMYSIWRSTDSGMSFTEVHKLGSTADYATQYAATFPFLRGMAFGRIGGRDAIICCTYNADQVDGSIEPKDRRYAIISYDHGATWAWLWELNVGTNHTRHFHGVKIDADGRVIFLLGDSDTECGIIVAHDITRWPLPNNVTPAQLATYPGFTVATGKQNCRAVDCVVKTIGGQSKLLTYTDTSSDALGGIWMWDYPTLANPTRVAHPNYGHTHDGWAFINHSSGAIYAIDGCRADSTSIWMNVSGSFDGTHWFAVGRYYLPTTGALMYVSMFAELPNGDIVISAGVNAGPAGQRQTHIYRLHDKHIDDDVEDILAPVCFIRPGGNDSNDGTTPALAIATLKGAVNVAKCAAHTRIVIQGDAGPDTASSNTSVRFGGLFANTTNNTNDASIYFHVSGDGAEKTLLEVTGSGGVSGLNSAAWKVRLDDLKIWRSTNDLLLSDNATQTGAAEWVITGATVGDSAIPARYNLYGQTAKYTVRRSKLVNAADNLINDILYAKGTSTFDIKSSLIYGGKITHSEAATVSLLHCTFDRFTGYGIAAASTVAPTIKNCNFGEVPAASSLVNTAAISLVGTVVDNYFPRLDSTANIPAQQLAIGSGACIGPNYVPLSFSPLLGLAAKTSATNDIYGNPFDLAPAIGAYQP